MKVCWEEILFGDLQNLQNTEGEGGWGGGGDILQFAFFASWLP